MDWKDTKSILVKPIKYLNFWLWYLDIGESRIKNLTR